MNLITEHLETWTASVQVKSSAGRGGGSKRELYGIKKLRELILELAVRGLLVPQDSCDEPTSELLKKIATEKDKLVKEKKIKKQKKLTSIEHDDALFKLPASWSWVRLGELGYTQTGGTPSKTKPEYFGTDIPFVKPADIIDGEVNYYNEGLSIEGSEKLGRVAPAGSILMVCIGTIGKCGPITKDCTFNQQINSISPYLDITSYMYRALSASYFQKAAWARSSSTTIAILNKGKWENIGLPLPPLAEQHRIVAKVDELMALCDRLEQAQSDHLETHETLVATLLDTLIASASDAEHFQQAWQRIAENFDALFTTEASIDQLKQSILQLAVMGKLVPQDPNDEPAEKTLVNIESRKEELRKSKAIRATKPLPKVTKNEQRFPIPYNWKWVRPDHLCYQITDGAHHTPEYVDTGIPFLSVKDMSKGYLDFSSTRYISSSQHEELIKRCYPEHGDLLLTKIGTTGIPIVINAQKEFSIFVSVALLKFPQELLLSNYLKAAFESPLVKEQSDEFTMGVGNKNLVLKHIRNFALPLPPLAEQHHIVAKVDELMALCDTLKAKLQAAQTTQLQLTDSLVEQAVG